VKFHLLHYKSQTENPSGRAYRKKKKKNSNHQVTYVISSHGYSGDLAEEGSVQGYPLYLKELKRNFERDKLSVFQDEIFIACREIFLEDVSPAYKLEIGTSRL
jgi:hypothetical protein